MKTIREKPEPMTQEELLEARNVLFSLKEICEQNADTVSNDTHISDTHREEAIAFHMKQVEDIGHLISTVEKMAEDSADRVFSGAGKSEVAVESEFEPFVQGLADGMILGVAWDGIQEILGEDEQRPHLCTLHPNIPSFPSPSEREFFFTEGEIQEIIRRANPRWIKDEGENGAMFGVISVRYFSSIEPVSGGWLRVPEEKNG